MKKQRRKHTAEFKVRVALEAIKGLETINEIATKYDLHPVQVGNRKKELLEHVPKVFERKNVAKDQDAEKRAAPARTSWVVQREAAQPLPWRDESG